MKPETYAVIYCLMFFTILLISVFHILPELDKAREEARFYRQLLYIELSD